MSSAKSPKRYYPIFIDLEGKPCLVVGGGEVAERKVETLLEYGAVVTVESPEITPGIRAFADAGKITYNSRDYAPAAMAGKVLAVAATNDEAVNERVYRDASAQGIPVNVVDDPKRCTFIVPSIVRQGPLQIAISTAGISPALSKKIRRDLEQKYGEAYRTYLELIAEFRPVVAAAVSEYDSKKNLWESVLESDVLSLVERGEIEAARRRLSGLIDAELEKLGAKAAR